MLVKMKRSYKEAIENNDQKDKLTRKIKDSIGQRLLDITITLDEAGSSQKDDSNKMENLITLKRTCQLLTYIHYTAMI